MPPPPRILGAAPPTGLVSVVLPTGVLADPGPHALRPWQVPLLKAEGYLQAGNQVLDAVAAGPLDQGSALAHLLQKARRKMHAAEGRLRYAPPAAPEPPGGPGLLEKARLQITALEKRLGPTPPTGDPGQATQTQTPPMAAGQGAPLFWAASTAPATLELAALDGQGRRWLPTATVLVLIAAMVLVSFFPGALRLARAVWPEQLALLSLAGMTLWGLSLLGLALLVGAALARLLMTIHWIGNLWTDKSAPAFQPPPSSH